MAIVVLQPVNINCHSICKKNKYMKNYKNKKIVAVGGGHGLGRMLAALKTFGSNATGIVATTDNGGSTGRIRYCQGGIAWGDTRNCINQLITEPSIESMMFEYRFKGAGELDGHNLGNLMLASLDNLSVRPLEAIQLIRSMLKVDVKIVPMSEHPADLKALSLDGKWVVGETSVDEMESDLLRLDLEPVVPATSERSLQSIKRLYYSWPWQLPNQYHAAVADARSKAKRLCKTKTPS